MSVFRKKPKGPRPARPTPARTPARSVPRREPAAPVVPDWRSYDAVAGEYARIHSPHTTVVAADVLALVDPGPNARILDVGTGTGEALAAAGPDQFMIGVDPSPGLLRFAGAGRVAAAETVNLPFRDATFDAATATFALPYFPKLETALFDVMRVLKPGSRLGVAVWAAGEDDLARTWRILVEEAIGRDILKAGLKDEMPGAEKLSDKGRLETALRDAGFRPVTVEARRYRFETSREDYIRGHEIEAAGRYAEVMLGERLWTAFRKRVRDTFADRFPDSLIDFRDVLLAAATKPSGPKFS